MHFVSDRVTLKFLNPEGAITCGRRAVLAASVTVPKAAMNKYNSLVFRQHDIRGPWQLFVVKPKPVAHSMEQATDALLGRCVLAADSAHIPTAPLLCQCISHEQQIITQLRL